MENEILSKLYPITISHLTILGLEWKLKLLIPPLCICFLTAFPLACLFKYPLSSGPSQARTSEWCQENHSRKVHIWTRMCMIMKLGNKKKSFPSKVTLGAQESKEKKDIHSSIMLSSSSSHALDHSQWWNIGIEANNKINFHNI